MSGQQGYGMLVAMSGQQLCGKAAAARCEAMLCASSPGRSEQWSKERTQRVCLHFHMHIEKWAGEYEMIC